MLPADTLTTTYTTTPLAYMRLAYFLSNSNERKHNNACGQVM